MNILFIVLALLTVTGLTALLAKICRIPLPLPLIQIAIGSLTALGGLQVGFDPDIFLLLFIPPLLFHGAEV